jgi:hypothetical protein
MGYGVGGSLSVSVSVALLGLFLFGRCIIGVMKVWETGGYLDLMGMELGPHSH